MKILGIDTTTKFLSIGLSDKSRIYCYNLEANRLHSALLIPTIERILKALNWKLGDIDYFACGLGPGSFTGIRVGLATIKGLSWSIKKPIVGISTLDILAKNAKEDSRTIVPIIDAKRNLIFYSAYKAKGNNLKRVSSYMLLSVGQMLKKIPNNALVIGDALNLYREDILEKIKGVKIMETDYWYPKPQNIIELAKAKIAEGKVSNAFDIEPIYLYPKECQIRNSNY